MVLSQISSLPGLFRAEEALEDCPICLTEIRKGENARELKACG